MTPLPTIYITLYISLQSTLILLTLTLILVISSLYLFFFQSTNIIPIIPEDIEDKHIPDEVKEVGLVSFLRKKHLKYGWIVTDLPLVNTISIIDPMAIKSSLHVGDRPKNLYQFLEPILGKDHLQVLNAKSASTYRELFGPSLEVDAFAGQYNDIRTLGVEMIDRWEKNIVLKHENVIRMQDQSLEYSFKATIKALTSADLPRNFDLRVYKKAYEDVIGGLFDKQFGVISELRNERIQNSIIHLFEVLYSLIDERKDDVDNINDKRRSDLLGLLVTEKDPETGENFKDGKIRSMMSIFLTFGYLTTGVAISWTIFCITQDRDVQIKIQNEIDRVLKGRLPSHNDLSKLDYLTQVIKESLRLYPPTPFLSRYLTKSMNLKTNKESFHLLAGTTILYPITSIHEDEQLFNNSKKFDPSRFSSDQFKKMEPLSHCPFGFGKRVCPAEELAMVEIKLMLCLIMQRFHVELAMPLSKVVGNEKFVLMARNDIYVRLVPREDIEE
ncbi:4674_t:CDS:2 [Funneliformis geosporum]|uniref:19255_t:CDS:1 n=1 Tax=Funneliformis geosporum TaxID=1117311 RepID=A0A9W4SIT8_9GLOM|nr:4674_t:CDS:2 [Funneliformis geosporum]CAI2171020.1 19255_t:CDS:2 [Funneliformis geosporum]